MGWIQAQHRSTLLHLLYVCRGSSGSSETYIRHGEKTCMEIQNDAKTFDSKKSNQIHHVEYKLKCLRIETLSTLKEESKSETEEWTTAEEKRNFLNLALTVMRARNSPWWLLRHSFHIFVIQFAWTCRLMFVFHLFWYSDYRLWGLRSNTTTTTTGSAALCKSSSSSRNSPREKKY